MDFALQLSTGSGRWDKQISQNIYFLVQIYLKHNSQNIIPPEFDMSQFLFGIKSPTITVGWVLEIGKAYFTNRGGLAQSHRMFVCFYFSWKKYFWWKKILMTREKISCDHKKNISWWQGKGFPPGKNRRSLQNVEMLFLQISWSFHCISNLIFWITFKQNVMECRLIRISLFLHITGFN